MQNHASLSPKAAADRLTRGDATDDALETLAQRAAQNPASAAKALGGMPPRIVDRLTDALLHALARAAARMADAAAAALVEMPPHVVARLPDVDLRAPAQAAAQTAKAAAGRSAACRPTLPTACLMIICARSPRWRRRRRAWRRRR